MLAWVKLTTFDKPSYGPPTQPRSIEVAFKEDEGDSTTFRVSPDVTEVWPSEPDVTEENPQRTLEEAASDVEGGEVARDHERGAPPRCLIRWMISPSRSRRWPNWLLRIAFGQSFSDVQCGNGSAAFGVLK